MSQESSCQTNHQDEYQEAIQEATQNQYETFTSPEMVRF